ncbi:MAG: phosphoglucosamine mutase [Rickettsiales bacterium]|nr:phosphoglucosamine mutase [Rickettsiales bacterium]
MSKLFGTDGIRGKSNIFPMDAETALKVGMAAGAYFTRGQHKHRVVIGKDTRLSGYMIESALTAGFISMGMEVFLVGPMPTPAVALVTRSMRADVGVMISASHNPYYDNGIKFFQMNGLKLSDEAEKEIEALVNSDLSKYRAKPENLGRAKRIDDAPGRYIEYIKQTFPKRSRLEGLKIVLDCANGAAYKIAPIILWELGAEVETIFAKPDGFNINKECGSTHPDILSEKVRESKADIGIALDGDADRLVICDEKGRIIDGDQIMGAIASNWQERGLIKGGGVVTTIMSNMGLEKHIESLGLKMHRTKVGDRYVMEQMREIGCNFGGEQSGHIIFNDYTTTGDGLLAALQVLASIIEKKKPASEVLNVFNPFPQVLKNIKITKDADEILENSKVKNSIAEAEKSLGDKGRIVIRKSGTEPLIRVMLEGEDAIKIETLANNIKAEIEGISS